MKRNGSKYLIPKNMSETEFKDLVNTWEKKLADSGHIDIEVRFADGTVSPSMQNTQLSNAFAKKIKPNDALYYNLCSEFQHYLDWQTLFEDDWEIYYTIWELYSNGVPFRSVANYFNHILDKHTRKIGFCKVELKNNKTYFWAFWHWKKINMFFEEWLHNQGYET